MRRIILTECIKTKNSQYIHINIIDHQPNITQTTRSLNSVRVQLPPKNQINKDLGDFFESFKVDVFGAQARDDNSVETFLLDDLLQVVLGFRQQRETFARELVEHFVFLL